MNDSGFERLAFWSRNMALIGGAGMSWPGFSYTDAERARMSELAAVVDDGAFGKFLAFNTVIFIVLAAVVVAAAMMPVLSLLFPNPAATKPLPFVLVLAATAFLLIGFGLPLSMRIAAALSSSATLRAQLRAEPSDEALARKVRFQMTRMTVIMCGVFVPGTLLWIAFNIQAGPVMTVLKWLSLAALAGSVVYSRVAKPT